MKTVPPNQDNLIGRSISSSAVHSHLLCAVTSSSSRFIACFDSSTFFLLLIPKKALFASLTSVDSLRSSCETASSVLSCLQSCQTESALAAKASLTSPECATALHLLLLPKVGPKLGVLKVVPCLRPLVDLFAVAARRALPPTAACLGLLPAAAAPTTQRLLHFQIGRRALALGFLHFQTKVSTHSSVDETLGLALANA